MLLLSCLVLACASAGPQTDHVSQVMGRSAATGVGAVVQSVVTLLGYQATVPTRWSTRTPSSSMRLAEFTVGDAAEVVVYFFGPGQGGPVNANLERWKAQFSNPTGGAVYEAVSQDKAGALPLTVAEYRGTYARGTGTGSSPEAARPNHILVAVVAETPRGRLFFQLFGPTAAVEAQRSAYLTFVRSLR